MTELTVEQEQKVKATARQIRKDVLRMVTEANSGHPGGSFSSAGRSAAPEGQGTGPPGVVERTRRAGFVCGLGGERVFPAGRIVEVT